MDAVCNDQLENSITQTTYIKSSIFALLPLSESSPLISKDQKSKFLSLLSSLTSIVLKGANAFKIGMLTEFDAQIGENLCQVRAYHTTFLARKYLFNETNQRFLQAKIDRLHDFQKLIEHTLREWNNKVQSTSSYDKDLDGKESVHEFMERKNLLIELSEDIVYLAACFFLAHFGSKVDGILQSVSLTQIAKELSVSKSQAKKLVQTFQNTVCRLGLSFVGQILNDLPSLSHYARLFSDLLKDSGDGRLVLPCFAVSEIIFQHALHTRTPILLAVNRVANDGVLQDTVFCLVIGDQYGRPVLIDYDEYLLSACVVIEAEVNYDDALQIESIDEYSARLVFNNPIDALLANTAMHPQYAGIQLKYLSDNPYLMITNTEDKTRAEQSFCSMKEFAIRQGCCKDNSTTLFMKHAYSDTIKNQMNVLQGCSNARVHDAYELFSKKQHSFFQ